MTSIPNAQEDLAKVIHGAPAQVAWNGQQYVLAEAVFSAGYRKPRTITTRAEVESLYGMDDSVVLIDEDGLIVQSLAGGWASPSFNDLLTSEKLHRLFGPAFTVLHEPEAS